MAMYYYASKLNEAASCSGCHRKTPNTGYFAGGAASSTSSAGCSRFLMNGGRSSPEGQHPQPENVADTQDIAKAGPSNGSGQSSGEPPPLPASTSASLVVSDLEYRDGQVVSGTLEALIDLLRPGADRTFVFSFLLCSRIYIRPHELLAALCRRHNAAGQVSEPGDVASDAAIAETTSLVRLLGEWTRTFPYDFRDDRVMALVRNITQKCASLENSTLGDEMSLLLQKLLDKLTALEEYEENMIETPAVTSLEQLTPVDIFSIGLNPTDVARQLTLLELHMLSFVGPEEFVQAFIQQPANKESGQRAYEPKKTRNLEFYGKWFNRLNFLVATDILRSSKTKTRARILEFWVLCARECFNLGNFNSLMAIVGALSMVSISRLKKTWARCSSIVQQLTPLEMCMEPSSNHARYRASLSAAHKSSQAPVPCFSITCRDLHFINQTIPSRISGSRINLDKCRALARKVKEQITRCHVDTGFVRNNVAWNYFITAPILSEEALEIVSYEREPPTDQVEKDRYKSIRHHN